MKRWFLIVATALILLVPAARAKEEEGTLVRVQVTTTDNVPIPNAWVRVPDTEGRRYVDPETGIWESRYLYAFDGFEIFFERGMVLELHVSAPGYKSRVTRYKIRGGKNQLTIPLEPLEVSHPEADGDITWFRRSAPIEPAGGSTPAPEGEPKPEAPAPAPEESP